MPKLTKLVVDVATPREKQFTIGCRELKGFGVFVQAHANRERRLPPRSPACTRPARRGRRERSSHHGVEKRAVEHARRRIKRKNGEFWSAQFCTVMHNAH